MPQQRDEQSTPPLSLQAKYRAIREHYTRVSGRGTGGKLLRESEQRCEESRE